MFSINPLRRRKQIAHPAQADLISAEDFISKADLPSKDGFIRTKGDFYFLFEF